MPVRVRVRDFQSVEDAEIVVDRFTVVTGPNNSGKTATMRAVQGVFSNTPGDSFVRHGKEKLSVEIDFGDGQVVRWEKGPKVKPTYTLNGKTIHPGRAVPDEVAALGIQPIQAGSLSVWPQIAPQFSGQVFLLDLPGSAIAEAVADVERVGKLTQALRLAEADKRSTNADLRVRRKDQETLKADFGEFAGLDAITATVEAIEVAMASAKQVEGEIEAVRALRDRMRTAETELGALTGIEAVKVPDSDRFTKAKAVGAKTAELRDVRARLVAAQASMKELAGAEGLSVPPVPAGVEDARDQLRALVSLRTRLQAARTAVQRADKASKVAADLQLDGLTKKAEQARKAVDYFAGLRSRLHSAKTNIEGLEISLVETRRQATAAAEEVRTILGGLGECPVCHTEIKGSHSHVEGS